MKRDTLGAIELGILLKKGIVEVFRDTDVIDSLHIAERVTKGDILLQKAVLNEYKSLQEHVFNGETIFLRFNDNIQKSQTDKDGNEGHWITTQDGNKAFIGGDGKLRFSAEQISDYVDEKESNIDNKVASALKELKNGKKLEYKDAFGNPIFIEISPSQKAYGLKTYKISDKNGKKLSERFAKDDEISNHLFSLIQS